MSEILLVRHCESSGQEPGAPLTERGLRQAAALSRFLEAFPVDRIVCSPYRRALQSIAPFATQRRLRVEEDPRLAERRLAGEPLEDWRTALRRSWEDFDYRAPGGETSREAQARARDAIEEVAAAGECTLLVAHGNWIGLALNAFDPDFGFAQWEALTNPDVHRVVAAPGGWRVERVWRDGVA
jgi:2,3-bisphosphoglycerate-dependent phosphoglycerate mutase